MVDHTKMRNVRGMKTLYQITHAGAGRERVGYGNMVTLHVTAMLQETEKVFWNTRTSGQRAFRYKAGYGGVVKGWDNGAMGMKVGETRVLLIPPDEGYGKKGFGAWGVPPSSTLVYTLECVAIEKGAMPTAPTTQLKGLPAMIMIGIALMAMFFLTPMGHEIILYSETHVKAIVMWVLLLATPVGVFIWWGQMIMEQRRFRKQLKDR
mmetsp:Transcript_97335/g.278533  ORF Transcript_97335/g.278533 Transcript_97335/m.278533 type:complete len:207 (+) Transcript_97335:116-736(+)